MKRCLAGAAALTLSLGAAAGSAAEAEASGSEEVDATLRIEGATNGTERPQGMAEVGMGLLTLPAAEVCVERDAACAQGDTSLMIAAWQLFRANPAFALGAGITLGLTPTTDAPRQDPTGLPRDHARRYMTVEFTGRYYLLTSETLEAWIGLTTGLVVVSDSFLTQRGLDDKALVGPRGNTIRTEGFTASAAAGLAYVFAPSFSLGAGLRYGQWVLPDEPESNPIGDEASLKGRNTVFDVTVAVAYRLPL